MDIKIFMNHNFIQLAISNLILLLTRPKMTKKRLFFFNFFFQFARSLLSIYYLYILFLLCLDFFIDVQETLPGKKLILCKVTIKVFKITPYQPVGKKKYFETHTGVKKKSDHLNYVRI